MNGRILWIDLLRIIGMIGVIIIHVVGNSINTLNISGSYKVLFHIIANLFYFVIPLFVMISGMLLLNKDISYKKIICKYIRRIMIVIVLFGGFFAFLEEYFINHVINFDMFLVIFKRILSADLWAHMWYLYLVIALYLITPLLRVWVKNTNKREQLSLLIVLYIFTIFTAEISNLFDLSIGFSASISSGFVFIYLLGNYVYNYNMEKFKYIFFVLGFISFVLIIIFSYFDVFTYLISYTSTLCILAALSIVLLFKDSNVTNNLFLSKFIVTLGDYSFGIYVIHQLFINIIFKVLKIDFILDMPFLGLIGYTLVVLILSYLTIYFLKKIKFVDKYIL